MLLVIDIGNTSITFGLFKGRRLVRHWRLATKDANFESLSHILKRGMKDEGRGTIGGVCSSSVVPRLNPVLKKVIRKRFGCKTLFVTPKNAGIKILRYNKKQIGVDRLVNAVAAFKLYRKPLIIIDFGTATTFDYVTAKGVYGGGVIAPGIGIINDALSKMTAKLPTVKIRKTKQIIAQNTKNSMQSGVFHGYIGLVDHIVGEMKKDMKTKPIVVATGGFAKIIARHIKTINTISSTLTLEGLKIIYERNI